MAESKISGAKPHSFILMHLLIKNRIATFVYSFSAFHWDGTPSSQNKTNLNSNCLRPTCDFNKFNKIFKTFTCLFVFVQFLCHLFGVDLRIRICKGLEKRKLNEAVHFSFLSGITTVLTLSTISLESRTDLPKVHYATALDWFIICSFGYCIATLLEFAGVHYFTKVIVAFKIFV